MGQMLWSTGDRNQLQASVVRTSFVVGITVTAWFYKYNQLFVWNDIKTARCYAQSCVMCLDSGKAS